MKIYSLLLIQIIQLSKAYTVNLYNVKCSKYIIQQYKTTIYNKKVS